jgi:hypothetical protein
MCAARTCLWLDDIVFYTFNLTGWIDGHMKSASPSQLQASKPPPPPPKTHGTNNIHSHIDGYTSKSTSQVLLLSTKQSTVIFRIYISSQMCTKTYYRN